MLQAILSFAENIYKLKKKTHTLIHVRILSSERRNGFKFQNKYVIQKIFNADENKK